MATAVSPSFPAKYHVFLSFRGEDTRDNFTSHLFKELNERKKINTFIDGDIEKGEKISNNLLNSIIQSSKISVIIFSEHYGNSKWCLDELVKILECKQRNDQIVIPVFYHVHPSDVRKQTGRFGNAFEENAKTFKKNPEKVQKWRDALTEASYLAGHESTKIRPDAKLVDVIVEHISKKLNKIIISIDTKGLIGIDSRMMKVKSLLDVGKSDFRIVGIWGMGGIGKTTVAKTLFKQISQEFERSFFMENVRERSEKIGLENLQKEILSYLLEEKLEVGGPNIPEYIKDKLQSKKVFIILDDVNKLRQLEYLAGGLDRFYPGSRVIITTRDKQVLDNFGVEHIYQVEKLKFREALEHFCNFAFRQKQCPKDLMMLSQTIANYAKGNPLILKVLGSFFYEKSKPDWEKALNYLEQIPDADTYSIMKVSYDDLDRKVQNIFLDIACFFRGEDKDHMTSIFDDSYLIDKGLDVLVRKSLVTISYNELEMHDLLQEMGREIIRQESEEELGKRSRLWCHKDILRVLCNNKGTGSIKGIFLDLSKIRDHVDLDSKVFANMSNLRLLKFYIPRDFYDCDINGKVRLPQGLDYLSEELRYLYWHQYPLSTLPISFNPKNLLELSLPFSQIERLWQGEKKAYELKSIDLHSSMCLTRIPDISETPNLEKLNLLNCTKLASAFSSLQNFNNLGVLSLQGCPSLRCFPHNMHFSSPITLDFSCADLTEFPPISGNVIELNLSWTGIEEVPSSVGSLTNLKKLSLHGCERLEILSTSICKLKYLGELYLDFCTKLESFPDILEKMESLQYIDLGYTAIKELPSSIENVEGLIFLGLTNCSELDTLPEELQNLKSLKVIHGARSGISQLPSSITELNQLEELSFSGCRSLVLPPLSGLSSLRELELDDCGIMKIPQDIGCLSSLESLNLKGNNFVSLPTSIKQLCRLKRFKLSHCNMLESLPELPSCISYLDATNCEQLQSLPELPSRTEDELDASILEMLSEQAQDDDWIAMYFDFDTQLDFGNCMKLNESKNLTDSQLRIQYMAIALLRQFHEREGTYKPVGFGFCLPGSGIPAWFNNQSSGSSINIQLPQLCCSRNFIGFALCAVIVFKEVLHFHLLDNCTVGCSYCFETKTFSETKRVYQKFSLKTFWNSTSDEYLIYNSDHVCLGFDPCSNVGLFDGDHDAMVSVDFSFTVACPPDREIAEVKSCGVCPVYAHPVETKPNTFTINMVPTTEEECRKLHIDEAGSINGSDHEEEIIVPQQQSNWFLSQIFRCFGLDCLH